MIENGDGKFWIKRGTVGIKVFPRVASTTLRGCWGNPTSRADALRSTRKVIVVRNPWDRLLSVWNGMVRASTDQHKPFPPASEGFENFVKWILKYTDDRRDWHVRSMTGQLQGYYPSNDELFLMEDVLKEAPFDLPNVNRHDHKTPSHMKEEPEISEEIKDAWFEEYAKDWDLYRRAHNKGT